jgi:dihydrofolate reductase
MGKNLVVGHSTFLTLPPLKGRNIYFISRPKETVSDGQQTNSYGTIGTHLRYINDASILASSKEMYRDLAATTSTENMIIAGGAKTYELFLPYITEFYVTHVKGTYEADTFMIPFEHLYNKQEVIKEFDGHKVIKYSK